MMQKSALNSQSHDTQAESWLGHLNAGAMESDAHSYAHTRTALGAQLARSLWNPELFEGKHICVVCAVEDADDLGRGVIDELALQGAPPASLFLQCYWNDPLRMAGGVAWSTVSRQYCEEFDRSNVVFILVALAISADAPITKNIARMLSSLRDSDDSEDLDEPEVYLAAPFLVEGSIELLDDDFHRRSDNGFKYEFLKKVELNTSEENGRKFTVSGGMQIEARPIVGFRAKMPDIVKQRSENINWSRPRSNRNNMKP